MSQYSIVLFLAGIMVLMAGLLLVAFQMMLAYMFDNNGQNDSLRSEGDLKTPLLQLGVKSNFVGLTLVFLGVSLLIVGAVSG